MTKKITSVTISNFRGISEQMSMSFTKGNDNRGRSILLYGENGTGKSSIVDAIEFATRSVVSRRTIGGKKDRRELQNLIESTAGPRVDIAFGNGESYSRGAGKVSPDVKKLVRLNPVPGFEICPLVIRRRDIDGFWTMPEEVRQSLFFDYFRDLGGAFLDEEARQLAVKTYQDAVSLHEKALAEIVPYLDRWEGEYPEHTSALSGLRSHLMYEHGSGHPRALPVVVEQLFKNFSASLKGRNLAAAAGKQALTQGVNDRSRVQNILTRVSKRAAADFRTVTGAEWVTDFIFTLTGETGIKIKLLTRGKTIDPTQILSEAMLDLLALLIFIEMHIECAIAGQEKIIILDDVFQSVDRSLRMRTLEHLGKRLEGWQILLTLHDRLWLEMANRALNAAGNDHLILELRRTTAHKQPFLLTPATGPLRDLQHCIGTQAPATLTAGAAGRALEAILEEATQVLQVTIRRKVDDKYTINDLWEPLRADLLKSEPANMSSIVKRIEDSRFLRNSVGAHFNAAAEGISSLEISDFADAVMALRGALTCHCGSHFKRGGTAGGKWKLAPSCKHRIAVASAQP
ncbi:hypothetical protein ARTSIC4J27_349 [Pseudarthrobacter siccitolerans]|uniref:Rad50/SbcC-type AAA domain-containing protein n=1 Tax=Pseudarthrobacter siccitolerans TaxID=861266 RepID=A0A024GXF0_9MICC|nr:AAA family ATPase [Pseudarthrobacter siccitolerans]CCQ44423.1 hypothetical protein ARTSIC4J27_349 [Pseudarthrobacter siccitolerans]